jgi:hypothetical protein
MTSLIPTTVFKVDDKFAAGELMAKKPRPLHVTNPSLDPEGPDDLLT